ncbi:ran GTPase-activating protein 1 [Hylaeus anthracinus]|uniref:ran GTPase-activating protein 1 n=1 Tax=Hylaeus volcanicus TaxID=313075 RepID=UPI0023B842CC|nr:ran GTPase-activating protein 1 [Hylaeus volcanicus]XP_054013187.1 ran GTPase-activating protein 1 [Hylaeus anthracinus]
MTSFNLSGLGDQLKEVAQHSSSGTGVSFANKSLKLDSEEDALEVVKAIRECTNLEYLDLEGNTLGPLAAKVVAEALEEHGSALKRALWKDMFTGRLKTEIPKSIEYLGNALCSAGTRLVELDLSDNAFGPIGVEGLANFLTSSSCYTLRVLRLNNNGLGISGGQILAKALSNCYDYSFKAGTPLALRVFVAGRNRLENEGAIALASVFQKLTSLEEVVMPQNGIYYQGITALANGLSANPGLKILNLNDNTIGPKGAQALANALPNFRDLEQLNLGDCLLKTGGGMILAEALGIEGNHPSLVELNLSYNEIHTKAANCIATAMADKMHLEQLLLDGNFFGSEGRAILQKILTDSDRIDSLGTLSDDFGDEEDEEDEEDAEDEVEDKVEDTEGEINENEDEIEDNDNENPGSIMLSKVTVEQFLKSPTDEKLLLLQGDVVQDFVDHAKNLSEDAGTSSEVKFVEELTKIIMKVSEKCDSGYIDVRIRAQNLTDGLYLNLCTFVTENDQTSVWNNALLVNLGLIKSEDKRNRNITWNLVGCFKALEKVVQEDYFLTETRNTLKIFLEKPAKNNRTKVIDSCQDSKNSLKAVLNRIQSA